LPARRAEAACIAAKLLIPEIKRARTEMADGYRC